MSKMMLHDAEARTALARGVAKLSRAVQGTLGPKGMNAIIDRPIGTPIISRDGVSIADEIELADRFENMGAQVLREVAGETNYVAGDGTTTATVLANALVQEGLSRVNGNASPVDIVAGIELAVEFCIEALQQSAVKLDDNAAVESVATIASNDKELGKLIAEAIDRVGPEGTVSVDVGMTVSSSVEFSEGMTFDRGYISHHMVTDVEKMQAVLDNPLILMTDRKITSPAEIEDIRAKVAETGRPLLIIADDISADTTVELLQTREANGLWTIWAVLSKFVFLQTRRSCKEVGVMSTAYVRAVRRSVDSTMMHPRI
jgi:chaperonin GroEL